jgi:hypothetical protein
MKLYKIVDVSVPRYPVVRLTFDDSLSGDVDFGETIAQGGAMNLLRDPAVFKRVAIRDEGRALGWGDEESGDLEFCADALRFQIEEAIVRERAARYEAAQQTAAE